LQIKLDSPTFRHYIKPKKHIMRNKDLAMTKLEKLEGKLKTMYVMIDRPISIDEYKQLIESAEVIINDLKTMIQRDALN